MVEPHITLNGEDMSAFLCTNCQVKIWPVEAAQDHHCMVDGMSVKWCEGCKDYKPVVWFVWPVDKRCRSCYGRTGAKRKRVA